jgi:hypothetical protein
MLDNLKTMLNEEELKELDLYVRMVNNSDNKEILAGVLYSINALVKAVGAINEKHNLLETEVSNIDKLLSGTINTLLMNK